MSAAWVGVSALLTRDCVMVGFDDNALTLLAYISDHTAVVSLKSSAFEPYHVIATRPGSPAVIAGKTLELSPLLSTWCGALHVLPCVVELIMYKCVGVVLPRRSENRM